MLTYLILSLFLNGIHWHLSGLSELPLEQRLFLLLAGEPFFLFHSFTKSLFFLFFLWTFFLYLRACCRRASTASTASAQRNQPCTKQESKYDTCRVERDNASKQTELTRVSISSSIHAARFLQTNGYDRNLPGLQKCTNPHKSSLAGVMREGFCLCFNLNKIRHRFLSPSFFDVFLTYPCMRRPGCIPGAWSSWHLQVVSLHLKSWTCPPASFAFCSILPCERG